MREIEFRGKRIEDGKWIYGCYWYVEEHYANPIENKTHFIKSKNNGIDYKVDIETLGQFTGLTDKNGTKIFEGDILCMTFSNEFTNNEEVKIYNYVKYNDGMFATFYKDEYGEEIEDDRLCKALIEVDKLEVVGNIYDNLELLGASYE